MRCGRCGADAMLGSAQCWSCGASLLDEGTPPEPALPVPPPPGTATAPVPVGAAPPRSSAPSSPPPPPAAPPIEAPKGFAPPPPPPPGWQPPPPGTRSTPRRFGRSGATGSGGAVGCVVAVLIALVVGGVGIAVAVFGAIREATDSASGELETSLEGTLAIGEPEAGTVDEGGRDRWTLAGVDGPVTITVEGVGSMDPVLTVREVGGLQLGRNDDFLGTDSRLVLTLESAHEYFVDVTEFNDDDGGRYVVQAQLGDGTVAGTPPIEGGSLGIRQPVSGSVGLNQSARYGFVGEGREVTVTVRGLDGFDPTVRVLAEDGTQLAFNDDAIGRDAQVVVPVAGGQRVTIQVQGFGSQAGRYEVEVT